MWLHYPLLWSLDIYKVRLCFIVLSVKVCTVGYICLFSGDQIFVDFVSFLSMIIYEILSWVLYTWCLRYNICSTWFLDIRISTCFLLRCLLWPWITILRIQNLYQMLSIPSQLSHWSWYNIIIMILEIMIVQQLLHYLCSPISTLIVLEAMDLE